MELDKSAFIDVEGIFNFRDIGGYTIDQDPPYSVRRGFIFRCANTGKVKSNGMQEIRDSGITTIFDLRSTSEVEETQDFAPITVVPGVKRVHVSLFDGEYPTQQTVERLKKYATDNHRERSYVGLLENGKDVFRTIFTHIRDHPFQGCIIFCNGGQKSYWRCHRFHLGSGRSGLCYDRTKVHAYQRGVWSLSRSRLFAIRLRSRVRSRQMKGVGSAQSQARRIERDE